MNVAEQEALGRALAAPGIVPTSALVTWSCSAGHGGVLDERSSFALRASGSSAFIAPCPECGERICARL
jgi:hypothetical protein